MYLIEFKWEPNRKSITSLVFVFRFCFFHYFYASFTLETVDRPQVHRFSLERIINCVHCPLIERYINGKCWIFIKSNQNIQNSNKEKKKMCIKCIHRWLNQNQQIDVQLQPMTWFYVIEWFDNEPNESSNWNANQRTKGQSK